jgi:hypothetical protein
MKESENASYDNQPEVWDYIRENPRIMGLPLSDSKAIDICTALLDVYETLVKDPEAAKTLLSLLATVSGRFSRRTGQRSNRRSNGHRSNAGFRP